jgi:uncharacterized tellurite resistance protein B-like protein
MDSPQLLQNYSDQEKAAYLSAIASLASADREASAAEIEFLQQLAQTAGLSGGATQQVLAAAKDASNESIKANLDTLRGSDLRFSLVTDLISFARADGAYSNTEEEMVNKIASYLGINQEQKQALETVVDQAATVPHSASDPAKQGFLSGITDKLDSVGIPKGALMAGLLGVVAPMVISGVMGGNRQSGGMGGMMGGSMGGLLGGATQGGMGSLLGGLLGGGLQQRRHGLWQPAAAGQPRRQRWPGLPDVDSGWSGRTARLGSPQRRRRGSGWPPRRWRWRHGQPARRPVRRPLGGSSIDSIK